MKTPEPRFSVWDRMVLAEYGCVVRTGVVLRRGDGIIPSDIVTKILERHARPAWASR